MGIRQAKKVTSNTLRIAGQCRLARKIGILNNPSMSIAKVIEVIAEGNTVENAIKNAASEAGKSIRNVKHINVENIQGIVVDGKVESFRVNAKVTFVVD